MKNIRFRKFIKPRLQMRLTAHFLVVTLCVLVLDFLLVASRLHAAAMSLPEADALTVQFGDVLIDTFVWALLVHVPLVGMLGVLITFRIAGPIYNFERYLLRVTNGERTTPCQIRKSDEFHELCALLNKATQPLCQPGEEGASEDRTSERLEAG